MINDVIVALYLYAEASAALRLWVFLCLLLCLVVSLFVYAGLFVCVQHKLFLNSRSHMIVLCGSVSSCICLFAYLFPCFVASLFVYVLFCFLHTTLSFLIKIGHNNSPLIQKHVCHASRRVKYCNLKQNEAKIDRQITVFNAQSTAKVISGRHEAKSVSVE